MVARGKFPIVRMNSRARRNPFNARSPVRPRGTRIPSGIGQLDDTSGPNSVTGIVCADCNPRVAWIAGAFFLVARGFVVRIRSAG